MSDTLLQIQDLHLEFKTGRGILKALSGITLDVNRGEIFGVVGETGCGKTVTGLSVLQLLPQSANIPQGKILFEGRNLPDTSEREMSKIRGGEIAMIFQDPTTSLNPVFAIGKQLTRIVREHFNMNRKEARAHIAKIFESVGLPDVERIMNSYPHQLSGGMQQRVMIALALACQPKLLIADEPTTALDVTIQAQILTLLKELRDEFGISIILITHNLGVVANTCDRLAVLYAGRVAESGLTKDIFNNPQHPYTRGLIKAIPRPTLRGERMDAIPGTVPLNPGAVVGCPFAPRCELAFLRCEEEQPPLMKIGDSHYSACFASVASEKEVAND
ncbi:MAG: ABC transporter ATP-binding protein [Chloroflexi bacterium]|nr:MAG: ABC transporter ATP-binding protein [Chloroflexota bacterium]